MRGDQTVSSVLIVGGGALGTLMAVALGPRARVSVFDKDKKLVAKLNKQGFALLRKGRTCKLRVCASSSAGAFQGQAFDLMVVTVKCFDVLPALRSLAKGCSVRTVLVLCNGELDLAPARRLYPAATVLRGVVTSAVRPLGPGRAELSFDGKFYIGLYSGIGSDCHGVARMFRSGGMKVRVVSDYRSAVWAKLIFSAVMNPLPVITGQGYDVIHRDRRVRRWVLDAMEEGMRLASVAGVSLAFDPRTIVRKIISGDALPLTHRGSMYYDHVGHRPLELSCITGFLIREADRLQVPVPTIRAIESIIGARHAA